MNIYLLTRKTDSFYDCYESCVVIAEGEEEARKISPDGSKNTRTSSETFDSWAAPKDIEVEFVGRYEVTEKNKYMLDTKVINTSFISG
jgi:hypothetical protein